MHSKTWGANPHASTMVHPATERDTTNLIRQEREAHSLARDTLLNQPAADNEASIRPGACSKDFTAPSRANSVVKTDMNPKPVARLRSVFVWPMRWWLIAGILLSAF